MSLVKQFYSKSWVSTPEISDLIKELSSLINQRDGLFLSFHSAPPVLTIGWTQDDWRRFEARYKEAGRKLSELDRLILEKNNQLGEMMRVELRKEIAEENKRIGELEN